MNSVCGGTFNRRAIEAGAEQVVELPGPAVGEVPDGHLRRLELDLPLLHEAEEVVDERGDLLVGEEGLGDRGAEDVGFDDVVDGAADVAAFVLLADVALAQPVVGGLLLGRVQRGGDELGEGGERVLCGEVGGPEHELRLRESLRQDGRDAAEFGVGAGDAVPALGGLGDAVGSGGCGAAALRRRPAAGTVVVPASVVVLTSGPPWC
jgi:hypothetical protein